MDKNTITGLVLIGILLVGFSFLSRPSEEQIAAQKKYYDSIAVVQQQEEALKAKTEAALANSQKEVASAADSSALFFNALHGTDSKISIQNNVAEITFTTKGGRVYSAMLKDYMAQDKKTPVMLFDGDDASMNFNFYNKAGVIQTKDYFFEAVNKTDSSVTMRLAADSASYIDFIYTLKPDSYLMNFEIKATGMENKLASTKYVDIDWSQRARQLEKGFTYENRLSELTYKVTGDNVDNLSAAKDDSQDLPGRIDWVAFKNQFFSSVFIAEQDFDKVSVKSRMEQQGSGYIKDYSAEMNTFFDPSGKEPTEMYFYFGPNHFKTLKALDKGRDEKWELHRLVYLGWPLIRWINQFITINVFDWLSGWGLSMGIVLLILTIMVKVLVYPATWKTYMSSAKMRVLKPKIDEINKKYPKQEDAMKKQHARRRRLRPGESLGALHVQPPHGRLMTRHDELLAEAVLREVRGLTTRQAVLRLFELGLVSRRGCEQCAIRDEIGRLEKEGMSRCEAFEVTAGKLCCSYEKVRNAFYDTYKH